MSRSSNIKSALHAARKHRRKAKRYDEGGEAGNSEAGNSEVGDMGELGGLGMGTGASIGDTAASGNPEADGLGGLGMGTGASIGDNGAQDETGGTSYGGTDTASTGTGQSIADAIAAALGIGTAYAGQQNSNPAAATIANQSGFPGQTNPDPDPTSGVLNGQSISNALANFANSIGWGGSASLGSGIPGTGGSALDKGDAQGVVGSNLAGAGGVNPAAGFGVAFGGNPNNNNDMGTVAGVPAEQSGIQNAGMTPGSFNEFSDFTSVAPGTTAANNGAVSTAALDAMSDKATGPTPDPATSNIQSVIADDNSDSQPSPGPSQAPQANPTPATTSPQIASSQPSLQEMEKAGVFGPGGQSISSIAATTGMSPSQVSDALSGANPDAQAYILSVLAAQNQPTGMAAKGGRMTREALSVAKRYAKGGAIREPYEHEFHDFSSGGLINSKVPGRTDRLPLKVKSGSYVIPASVVSGLGEGNTSAGVDKINKLFKMGPYGAATGKIATPHVNYGKPIRDIKALRPMRAAGGDVGDREPVKIVAAGGEVVIPPHIVQNLGGGDMNHGHDILDHLVKHVRKQTINDMKNEKPPSRD